MAVERCGRFDGADISNGIEVVAATEDAQLLEFLRGEPREVDAVGLCQPRQLHLVDVAVLVHLEQHLGKERGRSPAQAGRAGHTKA